MRFRLVVLMILTVLVAQRKAHNDKDLQAASAQEVKLKATSDKVSNTASVSEPAAKNSGAQTAQTQTKAVITEKKLDKRSLDTGPLSKLSQISSNNYINNYYKYQRDYGSSASSYDKTPETTNTKLEDKPLSSFKAEYKHPTDSFLEKYSIFEKSPYASFKKSPNLRNTADSYEKKNDYNKYMGLPPAEYDYGNKYRSNSNELSPREKSMQSRSFALSHLTDATSLRAGAYRDAMDRLGRYYNAAETEKELKRRSLRDPAAYGATNNFDAASANYEKTLSRRSLQNSPYASNNMLYQQMMMDHLADRGQMDRNRRSYGPATNAEAAYYNRERINAKQNYANMLAYAKEMNNRQFSGNSYINPQKQSQNPYSQQLEQNMRVVGRRSYDPNFYLKMEPFGKDSHRDPMEPSPLQDNPLQKDVARRGTSHAALYSSAFPVSKELQRRYALSHSNSAYYSNAGPFDRAELDGTEPKENTCGGGSGGGGGEGGSAGSSGCGAGLGKGDARQKGANIAMKAAVDAKAAQEAQMPAGEAAAQQVRQQLADRAMQAAQAAEAALAGKQQIVQQLEQEVRESEAVTREQESSLQSAQSNVDVAKQAHQDAEKQLETLKHAVNTAKSHVTDAEAAANGAQQSLSEKGQLLEAAKNRVELLLRQLSAAKQDYEKTKTAAYKAVCAAAEAKSKANRMRRMLRRRHNRYLRQLAQISQNQQQPQETPHQHQQLHHSDRQESST